MKKILSIVLVLAVLVGCFSITATAAEVKPGLTVNSKGMVMLGNNVYYGFGLNLYHSFQYHLDCYAYYGDSWEDLPREYIKDFAMCKKYNIQYARVPFSTWGATGYKLFDEDRDAFFRLLDDVVEEAERQQIGIIASLLWNMDTLPYYVGEKRAAMGDPNSKTVKFAKEYVGAIVQRYKDSPAIWGWEIGNEYNLVADFCDPQFQNHLPHEVFKTGEWNAYDYFTSAEMQTYYKEVATVIRQYDKYRMISNGNGEMRSGAYNMNLASAMIKDNHLWGNAPAQDTYQEFVSMVKYHTVSPLDTLSFHYQAVDYSQNPVAAATEMNVGKDRYTLREAFTKYVEASRKNKLATFFGEFGDYIELEAKEGNPDIEPLFRSLLDDMIAADLQLACGWFPWGNARIEYGGRDLFLHNEAGIAWYNNQYKVTQMGLENENFAKAGKQDTESYWAAFRLGASATEPTANSTTKTTASTEKSTVSTTKDGDTSTTSASGSTQSVVGSEISASTKASTSAGEMSSMTDAVGTSSTISTTDSTTIVLDAGEKHPDGGSLVWLWCVLGGVAVVAVAAILLIVLKKKKG